jgi:hypothetical protein
VAFQRGIDGSDPDRPDRIGQVAGAYEHRRAARSLRLGSGTLACPRCDAPVAPGTGSLSPAEPLGCPFCSHAGPVRDFLSLTAPSRPARVEVRVVRRPRLPLG